MLRVALKNAWAKKRRMAALVVTIVAGVGFMAGTLTLTDTMNRTFEDLFATVGENVDAEVRSKAAFESDFGGIRERIDAAVIDEVRAVPGVRLADGFLQGFAQLVDAEGEAVGGAGPPTFGFSWGDGAPELNPYVLVEGEAPAGDRIVIDRGAAKRGKLDVGDRVSVLSPSGSRPFVVGGIATFGSVDSAAGSTAIGFDDATAQELFANGENVFDTISVVGDGSLTQLELAERIDAALGGAYEVRTGQQVIDDNADSLKDALGFFSIFLLSFALVAVFVGMFVISNTFSIIVAQRTRELALLRAVGASARQVRASVLVEALVVAVVASIIGIAAGIGIAQALKSVFAGFGIDIPGSGVVLKPRTVIVALVVGTLTTLAAAFFPARKASKVPPLAALRDVAFERSGASKGRVATGLVALAIAAIALATGLTVVGGGTGAALVGVSFVAVILAAAVLGPVIARPVVGILGAPLPALRGMPGRLARENAMRNPRRSASTALALTIGVALVAFILGMASSVKASIRDQVAGQTRADYIVTIAGFGFGFPTSVGAEIGALDGVKAWSPVRFGEFAIDGRGRTAFGVRPGDLVDLVDLGAVEGDLAALGVDGLAVSRESADSNGWALGDTLTATFTRTGEVALTVRAIYESNDALGNYLISLDAYDANYVQALDAQVWVALESGTDRDRFSEAADAVLAAYPRVELQDQQQFIDAQASTVDQIVQIIYIMLVLAIVIALLGIASTLSLAIHERTREIGLLRAVGMTRSQIRSTIRWEAVVISLLGTVVGLVIGLVFGVAIVVALRDQGFTRFSLPLGQMIVLTILAAVAGWAASLRPAGRAAKLNVLDAIATD